LLRGNSWARELAALPEFHNEITKKVEKRLGPFNYNLEDSNNNNNNEDDLVNEDKFYELDNKAVYKG